MPINLTDRLTRELGKECQHQIDTGFLFLFSDDSVDSIVQTS